MAKAKSNNNHRIKRHLVEMGAIAFIIAVVWALTFIAKSQGY